MKEYKAGIGKTPYTLAERVDELPAKVREAISKAVAVDIEREGFVTACWTSGLLGGVNAFVLVTNQRVISKTLHSLHQILFDQITAVERGTFFKDAVLRSSSGKMDLFNWQQMPREELIQDLFKVINDTWSTRRGISAAAGLPAGGGIATDEKTCPDCAETIKAAARKCRFCGYTFS